MSGLDRKPLGGGELSRGCVLYGVNDFGFLDVAVTVIAVAFGVATAAGIV